EIPGHSMRGGSVYIESDVEYRAGIHMKEFKEQVPLLVIGGTAKDYCGEYMAGGRVVILNLKNKNRSPVGNSVGTGIHGGVIYVRGKVADHQLGIGAIIADIDDGDRKFLVKVIADADAKLKVNISGIAADEFVKITRKGKRPFASLYTPQMNLKTEPPKHLNLTPPCMFHCPTGIPTPVYLNLTREGKIAEAQMLMDEFSPFRMSVCGTVCPAPCMQSCSRRVIDGPVEIQELAKKYYPEFKPVVSKDRHDKLVSVIGAGPAGLSAAWQLARKGFRVKVFEANNDLGGKLRRAIPRERLSDDILDKDINRIKSLPIEFILGTKIDGGSFREIYMKSDAVIIATGAHVPRKINYPGGERIISGLEFLMNISEGKIPDLKGKDVVIIGAGNAGMDVACESWRLGAKKVTAVDIQKPLASGKELELASYYGTQIIWPRFVERLDDKNIFFKDGTSIKADVVIISIGELPDLSFLPESVLKDSRGYITAADKSFRTSDPKIYACGDALKQGLVTDAVGLGRLASLEVSADLSGEKFIFPDKRLVPKNRIHPEYFPGNVSGADRCLSCGTCIFCDKCIENCPQKAITRNGEIFTINAETCTGCYTCVNVCPRGAIQQGDVEEFAVDKTDVDE
ncbi:MAG: FAD-dependent oxidoreductase, partial [Spirochaetes bacterium]|nr:FAD-dependent oxidoreductase [Spirochaetota bacterium]